MADVPQRVRSHRLESEARRHLRDLMEDHGWVVRPQDQPDYGIDESVEVFDGDDATGLTFLVQSRGTDTTLDSALKVKIRDAQQNYFHAFSDPVLIVRYHSPTRKTLAKWFHAVDPYPRRASQTVTLSLTDELTTAGVEELAGEVRRFRAFRSPTLQWPVRLLVRTEGLDKRELELAISSILQHRTETLRVVDKDEQHYSFLDARVRSAQIVVHAGLASHTVHGAIADASSRSVAGAVVLSAAFVLDGLGHASQAADLFEARLIERGVAAEYLSDIGTRLGRARRMDAVFRLVEHYRAQHEERHLAATLVLLTSSTAALPRETSERRRAATLLEDIAEEAVDTYDLPEVRAGALLSAARIRFAVGDWIEANRDYMAATEAGAGTESKQDLLGEVAGAAHEAGDFSRAVELYNEALEHEPERREWMPRRADSLMRLGHLEEAAADLRSYALRGAEVTTMARLMLTALDFLLGSGFSNRSPDPIEAARLLASRGSAETSDGLVARCLSATRVDPWHAPAWRELGQHQSCKQRYGKAYGPLLIAALVTRSPEAWAGLFIAAWRGSNVDLAQAAVHVGAGDHDADFQLALRAELDVDDDARVVTEAADGIDLASGRWRRFVQVPTADDDAAGSGSE